MYYPYPYAHRKEQRPPQKEKPRETESQRKERERKRYFELIGGKDAWKDPIAAKAKGYLSSSEALQVIEAERRQGR